MKLIFADKIAETGEWRVFTKPDSALLNGNKPFFIPAFAERFSARQMLIARICKMGRNIQPKFASRYYDAVGVGLDLTADDLLEAAVRASAPWTLAKGFDGSAVVNQWLPQENATEDNKQALECVICHVSEYFTLRTGDIIFLAQPEWLPQPIHEGDELRAELNGVELIRMKVK